MNKIQIYENEFFVVIKKNEVYIGLSKFDASVHLLKSNTNETQNQGTRTIYCDIILGKISFEPSLPPRLVFVTANTNMGSYLNEGPVFRIETIDTIRIQIGTCIKFASNQPTSSKVPNEDENMYEKIEKKMLSELYWMFNTSNTFYYSEICDLSNTAQRKQKEKIESPGTNTMPLFKKFDRRFFWNLYMLNDFIEASKIFQPMECIIVPIFRGFFEMKTFNISQIVNNANTASGDSKERIQFMLISKQSFLRAGTRFKCRGIDTKGHVANFVETEQIILYDNSIISFVIIRGSIPLFWQQPTTWKYKPPFVLYNEEQVNQEALDIHMNQLIKTYNKVYVVNLVENRGREKVLRDSYFEYLFNFKNTPIEIFDFDFHDHCRKNRFHRVSRLVNCLMDPIDKMKYFWETKDNFMLQLQDGVFRVNCVDCLDRTNVVQAAISKVVLFVELKKHGLIVEESDISDNFNVYINDIWASNGDNISRSYAGTDALKSDYTRTGERNLGGLMLDGYKSLNRYYSNLFRDAARQVVHDIMHGKVKSASKCLSQWKVTLESTLQEEDDAAKAINFDIATFFDDDNISNLDNYSMYNQLKSSIIQCTLTNPDDFIKMWLIQPHGEPLRSSFSIGGHIAPQEKTLLVLLVSCIKILTFYNDNKLQRHCDISLSNFVKLKVCDQNLVDEILTEFIDLTFIDEKQKEVCINFKLIKDDNDDTQCADNFCNIITSYINERGNRSFVVEKDRSSDKIDQLENFFSNHAASTRNNDDIDFFDEIYSKITLEGYLRIPSNDDDELARWPCLSDSKSTPDFSDVDLRSINLFSDVEPQSKLLEPPNSQLNLPTCFDNNSSEQYDYPNSVINTLSSTNTGISQSLWMQSKSLKSRKSSDFVDMKNYKDMLAEEELSFASFNLKNKPNSLNHKNKTSTKRTKYNTLKSKLGNVGNKTKIQLQQFGNWVKKNTQQTVVESPSMSSMDSASIKKLTVLISPNGNIKLTII